MSKSNEISIVLERQPSGDSVVFEFGKFDKLKNLKQRISEYASEIFVNGDSDFTLKRLVGDHFEILSDFPYAGLSNLWELQQVIEDMEEDEVKAFLVFLENMGEKAHTDNPKRALAIFKEVYLGNYDDIEDYAQERLERDLVVYGDWSTREEFAELILPNMDYENLADTYREKGKIYWLDTDEGIAVFSGPDPKPEPEGYKFHGYRIAP